MACVTLKRPFPGAHVEPGSAPSPGSPSSCAQQQQQHQSQHHAGAGGAAQGCWPRPPLAKRRRTALAGAGLSARDSRLAAGSSGMAAALKWKDRSRERELFETTASSCGSSVLLPTPSSSLPRSQSAFQETPLSPAEIAVSLRDELKRLRRRRQIPKRSSPPSSPEPMMDDVSAFRTAAQALNPEKSCSSSLPASLSPSKKDKPIFTLRQMSAIVERMCHERTQKVREEYDEILQKRLGEQYDAFVKFIDHQIEQRFSQAAAPSYLS